jgi:hypothetical protein
MTPMEFSFRSADFLLVPRKHGYLLLEVGRLIVMGFVDDVNNREMRAIHMTTLS